MIVVHVVIVAAAAVSAGTGRVGELDGDWFTRAVRNQPVQLFDRPLGFMTLVKPYEPDTFRQT